MWFLILCNIIRVPIFNYISSYPSICIRPSNLGYTIRCLWMYSLTISEVVRLEQPKKVFRSILKRVEILSKLCTENCWILTKMCLILATGSQGWIFFIFSQNIRISNNVVHFFVVQIFILGYWTLGANNLYRMYSIFGGFSQVIHHSQTYKRVYR